VCLVDHLSSVFHLPAPFPKSNYVSDLRVNSHDGGEQVLSRGPHIAVTVRKEDGTLVYKNLYTWANYQRNSRAAIDALAFRSYGCYKMDIQAFDYERSNARLSVMKRFGFWTNIVLK
jgi:hypothetical protein